MSGTDEDKNYKIAFLSCIILVGLSTNGFIVLMFVLRRKLRSVTNYFVVNLAVSDFFLSLELILYLILVEGFYDQIQIPKAVFHNIFSSLLTLAMSASPASLVMVSFDRYFAISEPFRYNSFFTHRRAIFMIVGIWLYATIMFLLNWGQLAVTDYRSYQQAFLFLLAVGNFIFPLCAVTYFYCHILKIALSHLRSTPRNLQDASSELSIRWKQFRIARNVCVLIFPLFVIWSTYYIFQLRLLYCMPDCFTELSQMEQYVLSHLPHLVSAVNPITYILLTKDFRAVLTSKCGDCTSRRRTITELGIQTDNMPLTTVSGNEQSHGICKVTSI